MSRTLRDQRMNDPLPAEMDWRVRVFDSLSFPTLIMTPDKKIQSANRIFLQKYGMTMDQVVNKNCYQVFYNADCCPETNCPLSRVLMEKRGPAQWIPSECRQNGHIPPQALGKTFLFLLQIK